MKKTLISIFAALAVLFTFVSCNKDVPGPDPEPIDATVAVYLLNAGNDGENNALLSMYDTMADYAYGSHDVFVEVNGDPLGDLAYDMVTCGNYLYITMYRSKVIYVVENSTCRLIKKIIPSVGNQVLTPKRLCACTEKDQKGVFVTFEEGYVAKIPEQNFECKQITEVGDGPDGLAIAGNYVFVANRYSSSVSVLKTSDFSFVGEIEVGMFPDEVVATSDGNAYVIAQGNGSDVDSKLVKIVGENLSTTEITEIQHPRKMAIDPTNNHIYIICGASEEYESAKHVTIFDANNGVDCTYGSLYDGGALARAMSVTVDPLSGAIYVGTANPSGADEFLIYSASGMLYRTIGSGGSNPIRTAFIVDKVTL